MKLTDSEIERIRSRGLYITEKCDACGKILNQSHRYTWAGRAEVFCTAACRDKFNLGTKPDQIIQGTRCFRCQGRKSPGASLYCARCRQFADPDGKPVGVPEVSREARSGEHCPEAHSEATGQRHLAF